MLDAQIAAGSLDMSKFAHGWFQHGNIEQCLGEKTRGCYEILKMAKLAIDSLIIA
jgi:hypothetical protein